MVYGMTTIHGYGGSTAEAYANEFYHPFQKLIPFTDVVGGSFYYEPVLWAIESGITNGTSATTFGPGDQCMRAQVVTFLWRAVGSPEPTLTDNPFVDVKPGDFYYKPVLWALENGITSGMDATHFGPESICNRAQIVTFLYRAFVDRRPEIRVHPITLQTALILHRSPASWGMRVLRPRISFTFMPSRKTGPRPPTVWRI